MSDILKQFGKRVSEARKRMGISQEELAERVGVHRTYIGFIERGERNPTLRTIHSLCKALGISVKDLV